MKEEKATISDHPWEIVIKNTDCFLYHEEQGLHHSCYYQKDCIEHSLREHYNMCRIQHCNE